MSLANKHIVIIDDSLSILNLLRIALEALNAKVSEAATASGGLAICEGSAPDLIILDLGLPDKEGLSIIERLKHYANVPIIVLTVRNTDEDRRTAAELGANAYVTKPFDINALLKVIEQALAPDAISLKNSA
jgi:two-component system KDP operon response regulator KdpE